MLSLLKSASMLSLLLALWLACTNSQLAGEYQKGAYRPVRAPVFNPATDAPHTFRPGQPSPVQPGPVPSRVLPQTPETRREPGLWSAEAPATAGPVSAPKVLGLKMPLPENYSDLEFGQARACAFVVGIAANEAGTAYALSRLRSKAKRCAAAMLFQNCIDTMKLRSEKEVQANAPNAAVTLNARRRVAATARAFAEKLCSPDATPPDAVNLVATTNTQVFEVLKR